MQLDAAVRFVRSLIGIGEGVLTRTHERREIKGQTDKLRLVSYARFLDVQNQHVEALRRACEAKLFESGRVLMRTVYEGSVRFAWLARDPRERATRVDRWLECGPLEQYRLATEVRGEEARVRPIRERARQIAGWINEADWQLIQLWWEAGEWPPDLQEQDRLLALVDPYERVSFGTMKTAFLDTCPTPLSDLNRHYKAEFTLMSMIQHWTAYALTRPVVDEGGGQLAAEEASEDDIVSRILLPTMHLYAVFLDDFGNVWGMDVDPALNGFDRDLGAAFRAEEHVRQGGANSN
jgi:hypothetical protein